MDVIDSLSESGQEHGIEIVVSLHVHVLIYDLTGMMSDVRCQMSDVRYQISGSVYM